MLAKRPIKKRKVASSKQLAARASFGKRATTYRNRGFTRYRTLEGIGFPRMLQTCLKYVEFLDLTSLLGALATHQFSCNGMFDPNITGTGHQPMFFDNLTAIYDHYTVISSKIRISVTPNQATTSPSAPAQCCLYLDDDTSTAGSIAQACEQPSAFAKLKAFNNVDPVILEHNWKASRVFGGDPLANDNLQGTAAANPTEQTYYTICINPLSVAVNTTYTLSVELFYTAVWDELKTQSQS